MSATPNADYVRVLFGEHAVHVPAWLYVQNQGDGVVTFVGASRSPTPAHPLRYGSDRTHQFILGEIVVRPHQVVATDALRGSGLAHLVARGHDLDAMLALGEVLVSTPAQIDSSGAGR